MEKRENLFNFGFIILNVLVLFSFFNIAVFYSFYNYLESLPIPKTWQGALVGMASGSAIVLRPVISSRLNPANAIRWLGAGLVLTSAALLSYSCAGSLLPMALLRIVHGAGYVIIMSSAIALLMLFMPTKRAGQGFGIVTIMTLMPYAVAPILLENVFRDTPLPKVYAYTALLMLPAVLFLIPLSKQAHRRVGEMGGTGTAELPKGCLLYNLRKPEILALLLANVIIVGSFALVFFFLKTFCKDSGIGNAGVFFSCGAGTMIFVRAFLGPTFDRHNKSVLCVISLAVLAAGIILLAVMKGEILFYTAAVLFGLGLGAATPLINGLMYMISEPRYRGLNTNLMMEMVDCGFCFAPVLCGLALSVGMGRPSIMAICVVCLAVAAGMILFAGRSAGKKG